MSWWAWTLVFLLLLVVAVAVLFLLLRSLWRKAMALLEELGAASEKLDLVSAQLDRLDDAAQPVQEPAVFASPTRLRQQRIQRRNARRARA
jgi:predicted PurR-regulated permease PerM